MKMILQSIIATVRRAPENTDAAPLRQPVNELTLARDKRRLERLLRDRGMTRMKAASLVSEYFREAP